MTTEPLGPGVSTLAATIDTLVPLQSYIADPQAPTEFSVRAAALVTLITEVTACSGAGTQVTLNLEGFSPATGNWLSIDQRAYSAVGSYGLVIDPRFQQMPNALPRVIYPRMRVRCVGSGARTALNYAVSLIAAL